MFHFYFQIKCFKKCSKYETIFQDIFQIKIIERDRSSCNILEISLAISQQRSISKINIYIKGHLHSNNLVFDIFYDLLIIISIFKIRNNETVKKIEIYSQSYFYYKCIILLFQFL